jgi:hypothetical protein
MARVYPDGSGPTFEMFPVDTKYSEMGGVNERLYARDRTEGRDRKGDKITPTVEGLVLNERASRLYYRRDFGFCDTPYMVLHGDMGRLFPPQPWARGVLPIVPVERVLAFCEDSTPETTRALFLYDVFSASMSPVALRAAIVLLTAGWKAWDTVPLRWTTEELLQTLGAMGLETEEAQVEQAVEVLIQDGILRGLGMPIRERGCQYSFLPENVPETLSLLKFIWSAFEPFCYVPSDQVSHQAEWWRLVKKQGWQPPPVSVPVPDGSTGNPLTRGAEERDVARGMREGK